MSHSSDVTSSALHLTIGSIPKPRLPCNASPLTFSKTRLTVPRRSVADCLKRRSNLRHLLECVARSKFRPISSDTSSGVTSEAALSSRKALRAKRVVRIERSMRPSVCCVRGFVGLFATTLSLRLCHLGAPIAFALGTRRDMSHSVLKRSVDTHNEQKWSHPSNHMCCSNIVIRRIAVGNQFRHETHQNGNGPHTNNIKDFSFST